MRKLVVYIAVIFALLWSFCCAFFPLPLMLVSQRFAHLVHRTWARGWCVLLGIEVEVAHLERLLSDGPKVIAPNHGSMFDIFVVGSLPVDFKWISKAEVGAIPFLGWAMRAMGCYFVSRDGSGKDLQTVKAVEAGIRGGDSVVVFPEGTRSRTGELLPLRKGAFRMAQNAGVPIVPVAIIGSFEIAPPKQLPKARGHRVLVRVGEPMEIAPEAKMPDVIAEFRKRLIFELESAK